jgi:hypothetical protein
MVLVPPGARTWKCCAFLGERVDGLPPGNPSRAAALGIRQTDRIWQWLVPLAGCRVNCSVLRCSVHCSERCRALLEHCRGTASALIPHCSCLPAAWPGRRLRRRGHPARRVWSRVRDHSNGRGWHDLNETGSRSCLPCGRAGGSFPLLSCHRAVVFRSVRALTSKVRVVILASTCVRACVA